MLGIRNTYKAPVRHLNPAGSAKRGSESRMRVSLSPGLPFSCCLFSLRPTDGRTLCITGLVDGGSAVQWRSAKGPVISLQGEEWRVGPSGSSSGVPWAYSLVRHAMERYGYRVSPSCCPGFTDWFVMTVREEVLRLGSSSVALLLDRRGPVWCG